MPAIREKTGSPGVKIKMRHLAKLCLLVFAATASAQIAYADLPKRKGYLPATEQHKAIIDCQYELGLQGSPKIQATYVAYPWGGDTVLRILPHGSVGSEDAAWINACADKRLGRSSAPVAPRATGRCPRGASVLHGGSGYCVGY